MTLPVLALTTGEPAGIGPELALAAARDWQQLDATVVAVGDPDLLAERARRLGWSVELDVLAPGDALPAPINGRLPVWPVSLAAPSTPGRLDPANAGYVLKTLDVAIEACQQGIADAMVTATPGLALGVLSADCQPVLFADVRAGVIGAAHAGWRGAFTGIIEATIEKMVALGARRRSIIAALGPTIGPESYEVGPEFIERFASADPGHRALFRPSPQDGHAFFDLPSFIGLRLDQADIEHDIMRHCTYQDEEGFYSYRRGTHRGEKDYGRQISAISII
ncbi:MAG: peptidoglycan editing factor PgeF [Martelella sp.]